MLTLLPINLMPCTPAYSLTICIWMHGWVVGNFPLFNQLKCSSFFLGDCLDSFVLLFYLRYYWILDFVDFQFFVIGYFIFFFNIFSCFLFKPPGNYLHYLNWNYVPLQFMDENGERQHVWQTSWAVSTRFIGGIIMTHGDDSGLMLPPKIAPIQVIVYYYYWFLKLVYMFLLLLSIYMHLNQRYSGTCQESFNFMYLI